LVDGRRQYIAPSKSSLTNPRLKFNSLDISNKNLEGSLSLVDFANLQVIDLSGNKITSLNLDGCFNLRVIRCDNNPITSLKFMNRNFNIEIYFSQDELLRNKKELEYLNEDLKEEKLSLEKKVVEIKDLNRKEKEQLKRERDSRPNITLDE
jgi:hypothetical protein